VRAFDVRAGGALPVAGAVMLQASLYQFHDIADALLPRLLEARSAPPRHRRARAQRVAVAVPRGPLDRATSIGAAASR